MQMDLTKGSIPRGLILFSIPLIAGNLLQQLYNIVDTWVVGRYLGSVALAAVGSAFALMILLNSLIIGLCMGSGVVLSQLFGEGDTRSLRRALANAFLLSGCICAAMLVLVFLLLPALIALMRIPDEAIPDITAYLRVVIIGIPFLFLYNFAAAALRSIGNSITPLFFLLISTFCNIALDLLFVLVFEMGVSGAALATILAQGVSALGIWIYFLKKARFLLPLPEEFRPDRALLTRIASSSVLTSMQQSIMNFGILMIQSLVNSFGIATMAAFAAGVKIDSFAYSPASDFANGFATFAAQNSGAGKKDRVKRGFLTASAFSLSFCTLSSLMVFIFARPLLTFFIDPGESEILTIGMQYLRTEGLFYVGIGMLTLLYATFRGLERADMSIVLTVISLGLRVLISYTLAPHLGILVIWFSIPIGWFMADLVGLLVLRKHTLSHK